MFNNNFKFEIGDLVEINKDVINIKKILKDNPEVKTQIRHALFVGKGHITQRCVGLNNKLWYTLDIDNNIVWYEDELNKLE
jgi:hypothetical protein